MTFLIGLTGSIGMGKSSTAELFAQEGCAVWDADAAVHRLYSNGGPAVEPMRAAFPEAVENGAIDRTVLKGIIGKNPKALKTIEEIVHPLVAADRSDFLNQKQGKIVVLDIPLLFETGAAKNMDAIVVVSVDAETQKTRVLERGTMTEEQFQTILAKQLPDAEKRAEADFVIVTDTPEHALQQVRAVLAEIKGRLNA